VDQQLLNLYPNHLKSKIFPEFNRDLLSENAELTFSSISNAEDNYEKLVLRSDTEPDVQFVVKTRKEQNPSVILDLRDQKNIEAFSIIGTSKNDDKSFNSMRVSISKDGNSWEDVWKNDPYHIQTARIWDVILQSKKEARFVKIQLEGEEVLTIKTVNIYGS